MKTKTVTIAILMILGFVASTAQAQGPCTLQTLTGTYAFYERGSSSIFNPDSQPYPYHWEGAFAPFVTVGEMTFGSGGAGQGYYWIRLGSLDGGLEPIPVNVTVTEMNKDCTGKFTYQVNLPGNPLSTTVVERFVLFDNGRQYRSVSSAITDGVSTLTWIHEGHRISKPDEAPYTCGLQTANGTYLWAVENLVRFDTPYPIFSDALLLRLNVSMTGDYSGMLYEKMGTTENIELPISGTFTVNPDCSFATDLIIDFGGGVMAPVPIRGVFFDQGKQLYALAIDEHYEPVGTQYSFAMGQRIGQ